MRRSSLLAAILLGACSTTGAPPADHSCPELQVADSRGIEVSQGAVMTPEEAQIFGMGAMFSDRLTEDRVTPDAVMSPAAPRSRARQVRRQLPQIEVALLSSGGQFGAFTAGFMKGWSGNASDPRPGTFEVVTGVSTGALLAPFVFSGSAYDDRMGALYNGVRESQIFRRRSPLELIVAPSLWDTAPLSALVEAQLDPALIDSLSTGAEDRTLLVGSVNLGTGFFEAFDLTSLAASDNPAKRDCLREALMSSAAIPLAFPPRRLNGELYVDGAARQGLFLRGLAGVPVDPTIYVFLNNAAGFPSDDPAYRLPTLAGRSTEILSDELLRNSAADAVRFADAQGWRVRGMFVPDIWPGPECDIADGSKASFCESFTRELYAAGLEIASRPAIPWLNADQLLERLETGRSIRR